jgi:hypothetical protein
MSTKRLTSYATTAWSFVNEEQRIKVANRNPDNLLVSWVEGCYTEFDIPIDTFV